MIARRAALIALLGGLAAPAAAVETAADVARLQADLIASQGDLPVGAVRIEGLHRTQPEVVRQWLDCAPGDPLSRCDLGALHERLNRLGIFSRIDVALAPADRSVTITVTVEEKWTLYPVPVLWWFQGTEVAGLVLAEANLFGLNKGLAIGGIYSNRGWYTVAAYTDPNIAFTDLWGTLHTFLGSGLDEDDAPDGSVEQSFDITRFDVEYTVGFTLWDRLSPAWTGAARWAEVGTVQVPGVAPALDATVVVQGLTLIYSDRRYRRFYDEGLRLQAEAQHAFAVGGAVAGYDTLILDAKLALPAGTGAALEGDAHAFYAPGLPVVFEERLGGLDGSRTLPGGGVVAADRYASLTVDYQRTLAALGWGTLTGVLLGEIGRYQRGDEAAVTYGGPGVGLRFYLHQVSIPAIGADVGYELGSGRASFSVVVGYRPTR